MNVVYTEHTVLMKCTAVVYGNVLVLSIHSLTNSPRATSCRASSMQDKSPIQVFHFLSIIQYS